MKEKTLRDQKIEKVLNESIHIQKEKSMELESKRIKKVLRKKLLNNEEKNGLLTAFINLAINENIKQLLHEHLLIKKDKKKKLDKSTRFLLDNRSIIEKKIISGLTSNLFTKIKSVESQITNVNLEDININQRIEQVSGDGMIDFEQDEVIFHNQHEQSKGNDRYKE